MSRPTVRRFIAAGAFALALALAGAPPADARELAGSGHLWQRLARAWEGGLARLLPWTTAPGAPAGSGLRGLAEKEGPGIDPNGSSNPGPGATGSPCATCGDAGTEEDPNG